MSFSEILKEKRAERGWSLRQAAAVIGISHTYLACLERGVDLRSGNPVAPSPDALLKICNAYDLPYGMFGEPFARTNEGSLVRFLALQLRHLRLTDPKSYRYVLRESEKNGDDDR